MKVLYKIIVGFMAIVGALTIALAIYFYLADPLGLKKLFGPVIPPPASRTEQNTPTNFYQLSPTQKLLLEKLGLDPSALPTTISPELEICLTNAVGNERAAQIKAGEAPTMTDLLKAKPCFGNN